MILLRSCYDNPNLSHFIKLNYYIKKKLDIYINESTNYQAYQSYSLYSSNFFQFKHDDF